jgi:uncharacterized membrane protein YeaQ/YmgE (transglycosylase-associated protein family)
MKKIMFFLSVLVILSLALTGCGGEFTAGIDLPDADDQSATGGNMTLIYVLIGAVVLVAIVALLKR